MTSALVQLVIGMALVFLLVGSAYSFLNKLVAATPTGACGQER
jgi:hypothetical protein